MTTDLADLRANIPRVADLRRNLRQARRAHSDKTLGELLTDVYMVVFLVVLYGVSAGVSIKRHLATPLGSPAGTESTRFWLLLVLLVVAAAFAWRALRMVGPLITTPAAQAWVVSTPIDRATWLRAPLVLLFVVSGIVGVGVATLAGWAGLTRSYGWAALTGAAAGVALAGLAVLTQARRQTVHKVRKGPRASDVVIVVSVLAALAAIVCGAAELVLPHPSLPAFAVAGVVVIAAVVVLRPSTRSLSRIDRTTLAGGAELAGAAMTAAVMLDPSLLSELVSSRRWRNMRRLHSRHWLPGGLEWVLIQADIRRQWRRRADLFVWAALILAPYAATIFSRSAVGSVRIIAAYIAADRLAGGLRQVCRSPALRRTLGGTNGAVKVVHLAVPAVGLLGWWFATAPAGGLPHLPIISGIVLLGLVGAVYRTASRPPMTYDDGGSTGSAGSPIGPIPVKLLFRIFRGPDVVAVLVLFAFLTANLH
jgi:hypothetical protein